MVVKPIRGKKVAKEVPGHDITDSKEAALTSLLYPIGCCFEHDRKVRNPSQVRQGMC